MLLKKAYNVFHQGKNYDDCETKRTVPLDLGVQWIGLAYTSLLPRNPIRFARSACGHYPGHFLQPDSFQIS